MKVELLNSGSMCNRPKSSNRDLRQPSFKHLPLRFERSLMTYYHNHAPATERKALEGALMKYSTAQNSKNLGDWTKREYSQFLMSKRAVYMIVADRFKQIFRKKHDMEVVKN